jgi:hypothetical protein
MNTTRPVDRASIGRSSLRSRVGESPLRSGYPNAKLTRSGSPTGQGIEPMNAALAPLSVGQQGVVSTREEAHAHLRILLVVFVCALIISFCVSAQGAGICRHCCEPRECCTPEDCVLNSGSKASKDLYNDIGDRIKAAGELDKWIAFGTALTCFELVAGCGAGDAADAMAAIDPILRATINQEVTLFLANPTNYKALTSAERTYWQGVIDNTQPVVTPAK